MRHNYRADRRLHDDKGFARSIITGCLFAVILAGLITVTDFATSRLSAESGARADASAGSRQPNAQPAEPATNLSPKTKLSSVQQNSGSTVTTDQTSNPSQKCSSVSGQIITTEFTSLIKQENALHKQNLADIVASFHGTGLLTSILNPGMSSSKIAAENARHQRIIQQLARQETAALTAINC